MRDHEDMTGVDSTGHRGGGGGGRGGGGGGGRRGGGGGGGRHRRGGGPWRGRGDGIAIIDRGYDPFYSPVIFAEPAHVLDPAGEIRDMLLPTIQACHQRAMRSEGAGSGKVSVKFSVGPTGRVAAFQVIEDTLGSPAVTACIRSMLSRHNFQPPGMAQTATFSFSFQA